MTERFHRSSSPPIRNFVEILKIRIQTLTTRDRGVTLRGQCIRDKNLDDSSLCLFRNNLPEMNYLIILFEKNYHKYLRISSWRSFVGGLASQSRSIFLIIGTDPFFLSKFLNLFQTR